MESIRPSAVTGAVGGRGVGVGGDGSGTIDSDRARRCGVRGSNLARRDVRPSDVSVTRLHAPVGISLSIICSFLKTQAART